MAMAIIEDYMDSPTPSRPAPKLSPFIRADHRDRELEMKQLILEAWHSEGETYISDLATLMRKDYVDRRDKFVVNEPISDEWECMNHEKTTELSAVIIEDYMDSPTPSRPAPKLSPFIRADHRDRELEMKQLILEAWHSEGETYISDLATLMRKDYVDRRDKFVVNEPISDEWECMNHEKTTELSAVIIEDYMDPATPSRPDPKLSPFIRADHRDRELEMKQLILEAWHAEGDAYISDLATLMRKDYIDRKDKFVVNEPISDEWECMNHGKTTELSAIMEKKYGSFGASAQSSHSTSEPDVTASVGSNMTHPQNIESSYISKDWISISSCPKKGIKRSNAADKESENSSSSRKAGRWLP
ncbi:hypothetical protein MPTK1_5g20230 [Marchantia polymorpha subsp. ruderalis]|uniref:Uncharacterized protein n=1 Tax=Marchantia polymorpha subsp. ruderalis TaxID=1480154 RepID=A0AAF6BKC2_MARPO|nr:hypothetical protein Mp_5g20230 [Marchantia polymorpha subsp. ruderalis]